METIIYCDHCGEPTPSDTMYHYGALPWDVDSAYAGESGSVCPACQHLLGGEA